MEREHVMVGCETLYAVEIRLESLEVYDARCEQRIGAYVASDGTPVVSVIDRRKHIALFVTTDDDYSGRITVVGGGADASASIGEFGEGRPDVRLSDNAGSLRSVLYIDEDRPAFIMYDADKSERLAVYLSELGRPFANLCESRARTHGKLTLSDSEVSELACMSDGGRENRISATPMQI